MLSSSAISSSLISGARPDGEVNVYPKCVLESHILDVWSHLYINPLEYIVKVKDVGSIK